MECYILGVLIILKKEYYVIILDRFLPQKISYLFEIITYVAFTDKYKAYNFEKYLKMGSGRAFSKRHLQ